MILTDDALSLGVTAGRSYCPLITLFSLFSFSSLSLSFLSLFSLSLFSLSLLSLLSLFSAATPIAVKEMREERQQYIQQRQFTKKKGGARENEVRCTVALKAEMGGRYRT